MIAYLEDPQPLLREIRRVLDSQGARWSRRRTASTDSYEGQRPWNRYHAREYSASELASMLRRVFSEVTIYGVFASEPIDSIVRARANRARKLARLDPLGLRYRLPESLNTLLGASFAGRRSPVLDPAGARHGARPARRAVAGDGLDLLASCVLRRAEARARHRSRRRACTARTGSAARPGVRHGMSTGAQRERLHDVGDLDRLSADASAAVAAAQGVDGPAEVEHEASGVAEAREHRVPAPRSLFTASAASRIASFGSRTRSGAMVDEVGRRGPR